MLALHLLHARVPVGQHAGNGIMSDALVLDAAARIVESRCSSPVRLPDGIRVRCQSRLRERCPSCSNQAVGDWAAIIRTGIFDAPSSARFLVVTLTAPSFGATHLVVKEGRPVRRCRCGAVHDPVADAALRGIPLDLDDYDYLELVKENRGAGPLGECQRLRYASYRRA